MFGDPQSEQFLVAAPVVRFVGLFQILTATMMVLKMSMRGAGDTRTVMIYSFTSMGLIRVGALWLAMHYTAIDLLGVWQVILCDVFIQGLIFSWLHFKGGWLQKKL